MPRIQPFLGVRGTQNAIDILGGEMSIDINRRESADSDVQEPPFRPLERPRGEPNAPGSASSPFSGLSTTIWTPKSRLMKLMSIPGGRGAGFFFAPISGKSMAPWARD